MNASRLFSALLTLFLVGSLMAARAQSTTTTGGGGAYGFARVDGAGLAAGMGGIGGATRTTSAQTASTTARNFFVAGGIQLQPGSPAAGGNAVPPVVATISRHQPERAPGYRERLMAEAGRLGAIIAANQRDRRSATAEIARMAAIDAELRRLDRQVTAR